MWCFSQLLQYSTKHNRFCVLEWLSNGMVQVFDWNIIPTFPEMQLFMATKCFFKTFIKPSTWIILDTNLKATSGVRVNPVSQWISYRTHIHYSLVNNVSPREYCTLHSYQWMLYPIQYSLVNNGSHTRFTSEYCIPMRMYYAQFTVH